MYIPYFSSAIYILLCSWIYIPTNYFDAVRMTNVDPAKGRYSDEVVAEVTEYIYPRPVVECVRVVSTCPVDHTAIFIIIN